MTEPASSPETARYVLYDEFAAGGMATVHLGFLNGQEGFARPVAIKRLRARVADERDVAAALVDEARLAARVRHPNVVQTLDVVADGGQVLIVMEYVAGESLASLLRVASERKAPIPRAVVAAIFVGLLDGLHAAHEAKSEGGEPLGLVHRDVSPQNVLVGIDGITRVLDFGIAKAAGRQATTREGQVKGKLAYMAPEQLDGTSTRTTDVYAAGVCMWEALTLRRLFNGDHPSAITAKIIAGIAPRPSEHASVPPELEAIVMRALRRPREERYPTAEAMARAIEAAVHPALPSVVGRWVSDLVGETIDERAARIAELERARARGSAFAPPPAPARALPGAAPPAVKRRRLASFALLAALALALTGAAVAAVVRWKRSAHGLPDPAPSLVATSSVDAPTAPAADVPPVANAAPAAPPSSTASATVAARKPIARPSPAASKIDCNPPYTVDDEGVRRYKKACFK